MVYGAGFRLQSRERRGFKSHHCQILFLPNFVVASQETFYKNLPYKRALPSHLAKSCLFDCPLSFAFQVAEGTEGLTSPICTTLKDLLDIKKTRTLMGSQNNSIVSWFEKQCCYAVTFLIAWLQNRSLYFGHLDFHC